MGGAGDTAELLQNFPGQVIPALILLQPGHQLHLPPLLLGFHNIEQRNFFNFCNGFMFKKNTKNIDYISVKNGVDPEAFKVQLV